MKIITYIFTLIAIALIIFNATQLDFNALMPFKHASAVDILVQ